MIRRALSMLVAVVIPAVLLGGEDPADRLVQAELIEVSTGDLEKAMAAYKAILGDEKAPAAVRARAQLCIGRCQRKRGEIEGARETLEDLVKKFPEERETVRQARSFLRELQGGRAENPDFDWLKELEKNPEIQARVFDLAMDLVDPKGESADRARRQLLAMGTLALPVVERVLETSRDPAHRKHLALIAVRGGKIERLSVLLDPREGKDAAWDGQLNSDFCSFLGSVPYLGEEEKKRILEMVSKIAVGPSTKPYAEALRLAAGDLTDLPGKLKSLEKIDFTDQEFLTDLLGRDPGAADALASRILDGSAPLLSRQAYLLTLLKKAPEKLTKDHFSFVVELEERGWSIRPILYKLEHREDFDVITSLCGGGEKTGQAILGCYEDQYAKSRPNLSPPSWRWAAVLRKLSSSRAFWNLEMLAEASDEAVPEYEEALKSWKDIAPDFKGFPRKEKSWRPSPKFREAMEGLLDSGDQAVLAVALEALAAGAPLSPKALASVERLILGPPDPHIREFALYALLSHFSSELGSGKEVTRILLSDIERHGDEIVSYTGSPLMKFERIGKIQHGHIGTQTIYDGNPGARGYDAYVWNWIVKAVPADVFPRLFSQALIHGTSKVKGFFLGWLSGKFPEEEAKKVVLSTVKGLKTREEKGSLIENLHAWGDGPSKAAFLQDSPEGLELLRAVSLDPQLPARTRAWAVEMAGEKAKSWFDWPKFLGSEDPILEHFESLPLDQLLGLKDLTPTEQDGILAALGKSKFKSLRALVVSIYPDDRRDLAAVLENALGDPEEEVQEKAIDKILHTSAPQRNALLIRLLEHPLGKQEHQLYSLLKALALPQSIEFLVKLLDDPDQRVRRNALETLTEIRKTLEEKMHWEEVLKSLKEGKAPPPRPADPGAEEKKATPSAMKKR